MRYVCPSRVLFLEMRFGASLPLNVNVPRASRRDEGDNRGRFALAIGAFRDPMRDLQEKSK